MLFSCDAEHALRFGGELTLEFLDKAKIDSDGWVIDSRVHMLMPGWYPCIPGWHHDDIPRTRPGDNQPNYDNLDYRAEHVMGLVDCGTHSRTEFLTTPITVSEVPVGKVIYEQWHREVQDQLEKSRLAKDHAVESVHVGKCDIIWFGADDLHRGTPAMHDGWRFFIRASRNTQRRAANEVRRQVQVYMAALDAGW
jgi:hypothetical protein